MKYDQNVLGIIEEYLIHIYDKIASNMNMNASGI